MSRLLELQKSYRDLARRADAIRRQYTNTSKSMTPEEVDQFDKIMAEADEIEGQIEREQKAMKMDQFLNDPADSHTHSKGAVDVEKASINSLQFKAFNGFLKEGFGSDEYKAASAELKTLQADLDVTGGYLVAPQQFMTQLLKNVDDFVVMRRLGRVIPIGRAESLGVPTLDTDMNDADWTTELATGNQDDATRFGKRELRPHPFAKRVKVSNTLLRVSLLDPEAHVRERMAYKFGLTQEKGYLTGDGQSKPLGVFTADPNGVPTSRDVVCGSTTAITADGIIDVKHTLKPQYWAAANWLFHRDAVRNIRKLKDGNGQYLWQPGLQANIPNTILDSPYVMSEFAPNTFTTGQYVGMFADFSYYWIVDSLSMSVQRVVELYAEQNATGFIGRAEADGAPVLAEAFIRMKLG